ncbi:anthranilate synthase component I [Melghirimyces profundicolus]|uniref:anthranilate synthase component I n=1 Tax=Melghirimyces profundicolus TaxID=1242148 RepID=UPI000D3D3282|nr:anthranilate synthase component I [Melghirimyces profundicolus]
MYTPPFDEVREYARHYTTIPIMKTLFADTETPIRLYQRLKKKSGAFLLESAERRGRWGRYSFIGTDPFLIFRCTGNRAEIMERGGIRTFHTENPFDTLEGLLAEYRSPRYDGAPPFLGGAVGYVGFDAVTHLEPTVPRGGSPYSRDLHLMFCDRLAVVDHLKQEWMLVANLHVPPGTGEEDLSRAYEAVLRELDRWTEELLTGEPSPAVFPPVHSDEGEADFDRAVPNMTKEGYLNRVKQAKEHIARGDVFQIVPSQRWEWKEPPSPLEVYRVLRVMNPSPYMYCLSMGDEEVVGASPELLVRVDDGEIETRPIAGTRPRGKNAREDAELGEELLADEKERAEHVMLLDLGRNDLGRVSRYGTVRVTEEMEVEHYSHVMHLVSHVKGQLAKGISPLKGFTSCFPAGTVSGAPKVRAMQLLSGLEPESRGIYAGAIGYFSFTGNLDTCITIRTIHFREGSAWIQAGGGVVADSDPEREYEESRNKARGLIRALTLAERMFSPVLR